jgi:methyl-accepting chemotaxis protein
VAASGDEVQSAQEILAAVQGLNQMAKELHGQTERFLL